MTAPQIDKSVVASSLAQTGTSQFNPLLTDLAIGETVTFEVVVTLQEGQAPIVITDNLPTTTGILSFIRRSQHFRINLSQRPRTYGRTGNVWIRSR